MRLVNTPIKYLLTAVWLLTASYVLNGQNKIPINWNIFKPVTGDHWVTTLHLAPDIYVNNSLSFDTGVKANIHDLNSTTIGLTAFNNSPKRTFIYGMGLNYNYRLSQIKFSNSLYQFDNQSIGSTFFVGIQKPNIIRNNHPFINLGLTQRYSFGNNVSIFDNTLTHINNAQELNKFPTYGYLEFGIRTDEFLVMNERSRIKNLSISVDFPFFNRSNLFSTNRKTFNQKTVNLINTSNLQSCIRINYQQYIDVRSSTIFDEEAKRTIAKRNLFFPPLVSIEDPNNALFGRFFVDFIFGTVKDSVNVSTDKTNAILLPKSVSNQTSVGYNLHWGNYRETIDLAKRNKNLYFDLYANVAISKNTISSSTINLQKYESFAIKAGTGFRIGTKSGIFLLLGGDYQIYEFAKNYSNNLTSTNNNIKYPVNKNLLIYSGISYKNLITLRALYGETNITRQNPKKTLDNLYYSIAIGF